VSIFVIIFAPFLQGVFVISDAGEWNSLIAVNHNGSTHYFTNQLYIEHKSRIPAASTLKPNDNGQIDLAGNAIEEYFKTTHVLGKCWRQYRRITDALIAMFVMGALVMFIYLIRAGVAAWASCTSGKSFKDEFLNYTAYGFCSRQSMQLIHGLLIIVSWLILATCMIIVLWWDTEESHCKINGTVDIAAGAASITGWIGLAVPTLTFTLTGIALLIAQATGTNIDLGGIESYQLVLGERFL